MIKGINSSGRYITVSGGAASDPYISPGAAGAGMVRWNPNMNCMEVNDGMSWKSFSTSYATVELTPEAESLFEWARKERSKQQAREQAVANNPALKKAYEAIKRAEENFDLLESIAKEHNDSAGEMMEVQASP
jgi:hypothetical protein